MKHILTFIFLAVLAMFATVNANAAVNTIVRGDIYRNGNRVSGASVEVICNGVSKTTSTNGNGLYSLEFTPAECTAFDTVSAIATHNGDVQGGTVQVSSLNRATIDISLTNIAVPEFGMVGGIVAAVGSGLAYLGMKRKMA